MTDLLSLRELEPEDIRLVLTTASNLRDILDRSVKKVPTLRGRTVITLFYEASTRTRTSFELAAKYMSADAVNIAVAQSSVSKGESLKDTLRTLQSVTADCIVIRHGSSGAAHLAAQFADIPVINAGDGRHEHPTQGLLDALTIADAKGRGIGVGSSATGGPTGTGQDKTDGTEVTGAKSRELRAESRTGAFDLSGLTVTIVGDLAHSRVARSNVWGLTKLGAAVRWCGPATLMPSDASALPVAVTTDLREGLTGADVVMVLRLQTERMEKGLLPSLREYARLWGVTPHTLEWANPDVLIMHPGPMNRGVEISADVADGRAPGCVAIERQVKNGVAVRMACLYLLIDPGGSAASGGPAGVGSDVRQDTDGKAREEVA